MDRATDLLLRAADGDNASLAAFIRETQADVWRFCAYLVDRESADDLTQETYLRAHRAMERFRGDASAKVWLLSIARRVCADEIRRRRRERTRQDRTAGPVMPDQSGMVDLSSLLETLEPDRRSALILTQVIGLSYAEAAEVMQVRVGTVRSRVARARRELIIRLGLLDERKADGHNRTA
ncbi:MAG: RNA polymerase sigma factor [Acidimicrobiales bacterium]|nr:MAG: RNA polymerase sigma factor [Acidimicrobiales bacterium]